MKTLLDKSAGSRRLDCRNETQTVENTTPWSQAGAFSSAS